MSIHDDKLLSVFILLDCTKFEGCAPLCTFRLKEAAECLKAMAEEYDKKMPQCPSCLEDSDECNKEWEIYKLKSKEWKSNHPIGKDFDGADYYSIVNVPFFV